MKHKINEYQPEPIKALVKNITDKAIFCRIFNLLQDDGKGCVDKTKNIDFEGIRNLLYWDILEYLTDSEWGTTEQERRTAIKKSLSPSTKEGDLNSSSKKDCLQLCFRRDCFRFSDTTHNLPCYYTKECDGFQSSPS